MAAYRGHGKCVALLLRAGTDVDLRNSRRNTVLDEAKYGEILHNEGQHAVIKHLLYSYQNSHAGYDGQLSSPEHATRQSDYKHRLRSIDLTRKNKLHDDTRSVSILTMYKCRVRIFKPQNFLN